jgi:glycosyltransferase involved in cell wall biosynthesis
MKVSIITVCFNSASTIENTLLSIKRQTYTDIEHIVIDGGSTDGTLNIISRYQNHITTFVSEPDLGIYDAMNKGLALATGEIVAFLNADDTYVDINIVAIVAKMIDAEQLDALFGDVIFFHPNNPDRIIRRYSSAKFTPKRIACGWMPAHPTLFLRRSVIQQVGFFRNDYQIAGDFEYIVRLFWLRKLKYLYLPEIMVRMQMGGISTRWRTKLQLNREVLRACQENGVPTNLLKILSRYPLKLLEYLCQHIHLR